MRVILDPLPACFDSWNNTGPTRPGDPGCIDVDPSHAEQAWCYCKNRSSGAMSVSAYKHEHGLEGPGLCTSVVSQALDGSIHHARNLDWNIPQVIHRSPTLIISVILYESPHTCATGTFSQAVKGMLVDVDFVRGGQCAASVKLVPCAPRAQSISPRRKLPVRNTLGTFAPFFDRMLSCRTCPFVIRGVLREPQAPLHGDDGRRIRRCSERNACGPVLGLDQCARKGREDPDKHRGSAPSCVDDAVAAPAARLRDRRLLLRRSRRLVRRYGTEHMTHAPSRQSCIAAARACQSASMAARRAA